MKKIIFLGLFFSISATFFGQQIPFEILKSAVFQDEFKDSVILLSEKNPNGELTLVRSYSGTMLSQGEGFYIEKYDSNLKLKKAFNFEMKHPGYQKYNLILGIFTMNSDIHFVEIYYDLNEKSYICIDNVMSEDFNNTKKELFRLPKEEIKKIGSFSLQQKIYARAKKTWTNDNSGAINSENELGNNNSFYNSFFGRGNSSYSYYNVYENVSRGIGFDIILNVNETKTAFTIAIDTNADEKDFLKIYLFDNTLIKKMAVIYENDVKEKKCFYQNIQVSEDGSSIYLLAKAYVPDLKKKKEGGKYYYEFSKISADKQITQKVDTNEHFVGALKTFFHNNELISIGFYSDAAADKYNGICAFKLDPNTLELKASNYSPFTAQFLFDKYGTAKSKLLKNIDFKKVFFTETNEIIINAEESYIEQQYYFANSGISPTGTFGGTGFNNSSGSRVHYSYDDIIIAKLNSDGNLLWARNINKKQSTTTDDNSFISYTSILNKDKNYFFINTKDDVKKLKDDRIEFGQIRKNKSNLYIIQVDNNGNFEYEKILNNDENAVPFMVAKGITLDNTVYFLGRRGKTKQLLKVTL